MMQFLHRRNLKLHFLLFPTDFGALEEGKKEEKRKEKIDYEVMKFVASEYNVFIPVFVVYFVITKLN